MPLYMDVHIVPGVKALNVAEAHRQDLLHQQEYGCSCMTYWIDEHRESVFCLIEAPTKEAVIDMHNKAHGLIPHKIIEVSSSIVQSFLGRIYDPTEANTSDDGLKVFSDPSFRILMVTQSTDPVLLKYQMGSEAASKLLQDHNEIIRKQVQLYDGREVEHAGNGFVVSFASAGKAVGCAIAIQKSMPAEMASGIGFKMSLNAGEPIEKSNKLFGDTVQLAQYLCTIAKYLQVAMGSTVKNLVAKDHVHTNGNIMTLSPQDESLLEQLYTKLDENWQNPEFDVDDFCQAMAMSKSQLYRKVISLTGLSPNILMKEYRLEKAKELMKKKHFNISQITFDSGFTSPSYFTKCFKKKYGILPNDYLELLP